MPKEISTKNFILSIIVIIAVMFGINPYLGAGKMDNVGEGIKGIIEEVMKDYICEIKLNTEFRIDEYIKLILKNAKKIIDDPSDVKESDIDLCISYLGKIPEERKTEDVKAAIQLIIEWDQNNP